MASKNNPKFYIHHKRFFISKKYKNQNNFVLNLLFNIGNFLIGFYKFLENLCYKTGLALLLTVKKISRLIVNDIINTSDNFEKRVVLILRNKTFYNLSIFLVICLASWLGIRSLNLVANGLDLKNRLMSTATIGNLYLNQAKNDLVKRDLVSAQNSFSRAFITFNKGKEDILSSGQVLNSVLNFIPQKKVADKLLEAASLISESGQEIIQLDNELKNLKLSPSGLVAENISVPETLERIEVILYNTNQKIYLANQLVKSIDLNLIPADKRQEFVSSQNQLENAKEAFLNLNRIFKLAKNILVGQKEVLVLFQNNNELRATGGFIGTYGSLKINNGTISSIKISSIYDLDGQLTSQIKPPKPLLNLGSRWFMRDSNWFANFPKSAQKAIDFYEMEAGKTSDLVIAITPDIINEFLKISGPIYLPKYNLTLNSENFVEQTQVYTTLSNELSTNSPKQILADLFPILLNKLSLLTKEQLPELVLSIQNQLVQKQIALYSRDPEIQSTLADFGWTAEIEKTDRDYLAIISSNLGGTKTDLNMDQSISLQTEIDANGKIVNKLTVTKRNKMPDLSSTDNLSYMRIFVPFGSKLLDSNGFDYMPLEFPNDKKYKIDSDVLEWEKNSVTDNLTGTRIGQEAGKTIFSNWLKVRGGETKTFSLTYELPFKLSLVDRYSLLVQKQLGATGSKFSWQNSYNSRHIEWKNFDPTNIDSSSLNIDLNLDKDLFLGLVFKKD